MRKSILMKIKKILWAEYSTVRTTYKSSFSKNNRTITVEFMEFMDWKRRFRTLAGEWKYKAVVVPADTGGVLTGSRVDDGVHHDLGR
jgi:hypothetical protein